jgi:Na+-driven multidrug efflux pump
VEEGLMHTYQKVILTIYAIFSLPILPLMVFVYPFIKWTTLQKDEKIKLDITEFLAMSAAISIIVYLYIAAFYFLPGHP